MKIKGFNDKEQKCFNVLKDGKDHTILEMSEKLWAQAEEHMAKTYEKGSYEEQDIYAQSQSFVRNSIRRLIRDGWVEKRDYGTYRLTRSGKKWVAEGVNQTKSFGTKRGRKPKEKLIGSSVKKSKAKKKTTKKKNSNGKAIAKVRAKEAKKRVGKAVSFERARKAQQEIVEL